MACVKTSIKVESLEEKAQEIPLFIVESATLTVVPCFQGNIDTFQPFYKTIFD